MSAKFGWGVGDLAVTGSASTIFGDPVRPGRTDVVDVGLSLGERPAA